MSAKQKDPLAWYVPPEVLLWLDLLVMSLMAGLAMSLRTAFFAVRRGGPTFVLLTFGLVLVGVLLLFFARLPLYRQRRFLTFGPGQLAGVHRRLYFAAYVCLGFGVVMMLALICCL
ncbi:MAG: hypothetical protein WCS99_09240 [Limisphaerales bacterium]